MSEVSYQCPVCKFGMDYVASSDDHHRYECPYGTKLLVPKKEEKKMADTKFREIDTLVRDLTIQALETVIKNLQGITDALRPFPDFPDIPEEKK